MSKRIVGISLVGGVLLSILLITGCRTTPDEVLLSFPGSIEGRFAIVPFPGHELYIVGKDNLDIPQVAFSTSNRYASLSSPAWSPDGNDVAFAVRAGTLDIGKVVILDLTDGKTKAHEFRLENVIGETADGTMVSRTATCAAGSNPIWARDGNHVALGCDLRFVSQEDIEPYLPRAEDSIRVYIWSVQTQESVEITLPRTVTYAYWRDMVWQSFVQDDHLLINVSRRDPNSRESLGDQVWLLDTEDGTHKVLVDCESLVDGSFCSGKLSPQGRYVAVSRNDEQIYILDLWSGGGARYELPKGASGATAKGAWSPDGTRMAFGGTNLFLLDLDTGEVEILQAGYSHRPLFGRAEWVGFNSPQWLDDNHIAVVRKRAQSIPGNWEHRENDVYLEIVHIEDQAVWTVFKREYEYEGGLKFDWSPLE